MSGNDDDNIDIPPLRAQRLDAPLLVSYFHSLLSRSLGPFDDFPRPAQKYFAFFQRWGVPCLVLALSKGEEPVLKSLGISFPKGEKGFLRQVAYCMAVLFLPLAFERHRYPREESIEEETQDDGDEGSSSQRVSLASRRRKKVLKWLYRARHFVLTFVGISYTLHCWTVKGPNAPSAEAAKVFPALHVLYGHQRWLRHVGSDVAHLLGSQSLFVARESHTWLRDLCR